MWMAVIYSIPCAHSPYQLCLQLMEALKEKIAKRAKKVRGKYNEKNLETANVDALDEAIKIAMETASMVNYIAIK